MKRIIYLLFFVLGLVGCSNQVLSDEYDKETLMSSSQWVVEQLNAGNYEEVASLVQSDLRAQLNSEVIEQAWIPLQEQLGFFNSISNYIISEKGDYVVVIVLAKYENKILQLTLSYNEEMELVGLYMK